MKNTKWVTYVLAQIHFKVTDVLALLGNLCLGSSHLFLKPLFSCNQIQAAEIIFYSPYRGVLFGSQFFLEILRRC